MADQYNTLSPEDYAQQQQINRQQRMAEMLMQNTQQPQGQMVSGRYVAPSFFQNILPLVNAYVGKGMLEEGDKKQQALAEAIRGKQNQQVQGYLSAMQGTPAVMPEIQRDDMGNVMPPVEKASGPNFAEAFKYATNPYAPAPLQAAGYAMLKPEKLAAGESMYTPNFATNKFTPTISNPKEITPTESQKDYAVAVQQGYKGSFMDYLRDVKNMREQRVRISVGGGGGGNVGPMGGQGGFDKKGNFISTNGAIFTPVEIRKDREEVGSLINALQSINKISKEDVAASDTILGNVSEGGFKGYVAKQAGLDQVIAAQNKINAAGVMQILNNLPPGPASDKDIAMARSSFPGYGNAKALQSWIDNTNNVLTQKVGNYEQKYGGMTWYGNANPMQTNTQSGGDFKIKEKGK
jgi:hypothetical protein